MNITRTSIWLIKKKKKVGKINATFCFKYMKTSII